MVNYARRKSYFVANLELQIISFLIIGIPVEKAGDGGVDVGGYLKRHMKDKNSGHLVSKAILPVRKEEKIVSENQSHSITMKKLYDYRSRSGAKRPYALIRPCVQMKSGNISFTSRKRLYHEIGFSKVQLLRLRAEINSDNVW